MQSNKGFTIIELIVVIAIIVILAAIVLVNVTQYISKARDAAVVADLGQLQTIATEFFIDNGSFTPTPGPDFCNSQQVIDVGNAIYNMGHNYKLNCYDSGNEWHHAYNNADSYTAYATTTSSCSPSKAILFVTDTANTGSVDCITVSASSGGSGGGTGGGGSSGVVQLGGVPDGCTCS